MSVSPRPDLASEEGVRLAVRATGLLAAFSTRGVLAPGATLQADFTVQTSCASSAGALVAGVQVFGDTTDANPSNDRATLSVAVAAAGSPAVRDPSQYGVRPGHPGLR